MSDAVDLETALPKFCDRRTPAKESAMTQPHATAPVTPAPRQKRNSAYCVVLKVNIPVTDSASLVDAMKCAEEMSGADHWPDGSEIKIDGQVRKV